MYIDASAILAILFEEPEAEAFGQRIDQANTPLRTSPVSVFEAAVNLSRIRGIDQAEAYNIVINFLTAGNITNSNITPEAGLSAAQAYAKYGKGSGHKAQLNMGDAFSYGCAKHYGVPLLYKGDDFKYTDLA